jgi:hypothetical protein
MASRPSSNLVAPSFSAPCKLKREPVAVEAAIVYQFGESKRGAGVRWSIDGEGLIVWRGVSMVQCGITRVGLLLVAAGCILSAQPEELLPRFRAGAALIQVDAYLAKEGVPVTDLRLEDLEVLG